MSKAIALVMSVLACTAFAGEATKTISGQVEADHGRIVKYEVDLPPTLEADWGGAPPPAHFDKIDYVTRSHGQLSSGLAVTIGIAPKHKSIDDALEFAKSFGSELEVVRKDKLPRGYFITLHGDQAGWIVYVVTGSDDATLGCLARGMFSKEPRDRVEHICGSLRIRSIRP